MAVDRFIIISNVRLEKKNVLIVKGYKRQHCIKSKNKKGGVKMKNTVNSTKMENTEIKMKRKFV